MLMHPQLSKKINEMLSSLSFLYDTEEFKNSLNESGSLNPHNFSLLPDVKKVIQFMVDNDVKVKDLHENGFTVAAMILDFSVVQKRDII